VGGYYVRFHLPSLIITCRCNGGAFVDKEEYNEANIIACPLRGCRHAWCKNCSQTIEISGPRHSCDGSNELSHLMRQRGWKACPGCRTPTEKNGGCNHMTVSPKSRFKRCCALIFLSSAYLLDATCIFATCAAKRLSSQLFSQRFVEGSRSITDVVDCLKYLRSELG
jgi:hypothetical protein